VKNFYGFNRAAGRLQTFLQGHLRCFSAARALVKDKVGLEIGGPSAVFSGWYKPLPIYDDVAALDNCDISRNTAWATHSENYNFSSRRTPGKNFFVDGSDMSGVADNSYDFVLSSHNLEHFANPVKALKEWQRVTRPGGGLILVVPDHTRTFDHRRKPTLVSHMLDDFNRDTKEDDLTHLQEILDLHDLSMDPPAGSPEDFRQRSLDNYNNRCLHHHVFDEHNSKELLTQLGMTVLAVETALPFHIFLLARMQ
jgi:SAM-dependent methyltransferase